MFTENEYTNRRQLLADRLGNGLVVLLAAPALARGCDLEYEYIPECNFRYLCPYTEPNSAFVMCVKDSKYTTLLFCLEPIGKRLSFEGKNETFDQISERCHIDMVKPIEKFEIIIRRLLLKTRLNLHILLGQDKIFTKKLSLG